MKTTSFNHNFTSKDVNAIMGYNKCLRDVYSLLAEKTEFNPAKRMVDAVDILEKIEATSDELSGLLEKAEIELKSQLVNQN